jgi:hypothetical protein
VATPSQYCVATPDHSSLFVPRPLNKAASRGATPTVSPDKLVDPAGVAVPHCEPQNTR